VVKRVRGVKRERARMAGMLSDTKPEAEKVWIELWRKATPTERLQRALSVTDMVLRMSRQAIAKARPEMSPRDRDLFWVELNYGRETAQRLREHLARR
jgi:hypothetical protein